MTELTHKIQWDQKFEEEADCLQGAPHGIREERPCLAEGPCGGVAQVPPRNGCTPADGTECDFGDLLLPSGNNGDLCCKASPILIDLSGRGFSLSDVVGGVPFNLTGSNPSLQAAWPTQSSGNAWLALDRNGNGTIDDGLELFGNFTQQSPYSDGENGFHALAEFDKPENGGNEDGWITSADGVFASLARH
ncbi:MAG: hypothetical protein HYR56_15870 [Acidobacteria bacterium]|nr:hypothetical protein [Acidobacteriota bacterium]MBI3425281.1 hypothetical protein [Acidobacteriota bacterium]